MEENPDLVLNKILILRESMILSDLKALIRNSSSKLMRETRFPPHVNQSKMLKETNFDIALMKSDFSK